MHPTICVGAELYKQTQVCRRGCSTIAGPTCTSCTTSCTGEVHIARQRAANSTLTSNLNGSRQCGYASGVFRLARLPLPNPARQVSVSASALSATGLPALAGLARARDVLQWPTREVGGSTAARTEARAHADERSAAACAASTDAQSSFSLVVRPSLHRLSDAIQPYYSSRGIAADAGIDPLPGRGGPGQQRSRDPATRPGGRPTAPRPPGSRPALGGRGRDEGAQGPVGGRAGRCGRGAGGEERTGRGAGRLAAP